MARLVRDLRLDSRSARMKLAISDEPYWRKIARGCHIGYRKLRSGGSWTARYRDIEGRKNFKVIGPADDILDADGSLALNFDQAQEKARDWYRNISSSGASERRGTYTVELCLRDYLAWAKQHRKSHRHLKVYTEAFVIPRLGKVDTASLTSALIRKWHQGIADEPPRLRTSLGKEQRYRPEDGDSSEIQRKRRLRANRHLVLLRAALNRGWREGFIARNDAWARVQPYPNTERPRSRFLSLEEAGRLLNASPTDLRALVQLALLSGARFGELAALTCRDFQAESGTLHIRDSKSGRPRHVILNEEGRQFCDELTMGRPMEVPLLVKADGSPWRRDHQHRPFRQAVVQAGIDPSFTFHELRHTWASHTLMAGAPLMVVAQNLGHRDTRMVERHYGHLANSYVVDVIRRTSPSFGLSDRARVIPLRRVAP